MVIFLCWFLPKIGSLPCVHVRVCAFICVCVHVIHYYLSIISLSYTKIRFISQKHGVNSGVSVIYNPPAIISDRLIDRRANRTPYQCQLRDAQRTRWFSDEWTSRRFSYAMRWSRRETSVYAARVVPRYSISETWKERHVMRQPLRSLL